MCQRGTKIHHGQSDLLLRVDDEDGADGKNNVLAIQITLVDHVVEESDFPVGIGNDGELEVGVGELVNVLDPLVVRTKIIGTLDYMSV